MIEIQFLGTSSGIPSLTRNFPSISIKDLRSGDINLFDVGEGTQRQILRYGLGLGKIRRIFISHLHIDHFLGLYGLVETYKVYGIELPEIYLPDRIPYIASEFPFKFIRAKTLVDTENYRIDAFRVKHMKNSYGFVFESKGIRKFIPERIKGLNDRDFINLKSKGYTIKGENVVKIDEITYIQAGIRILYTGDSMFYPDLVNIIEHADVVIHDSTFLDEDREAKDKKHSTALQAREMARLLGAKLLILTHISNKYESWRDEDIISKIADGRVPIVVARDGMKITLKRMESGDIEYNIKI